MVLSMDLFVERVIFQAESFLEKIAKGCQELSTHFMRPALMAKPKVSMKSSKGASGIGGREAWWC